MGAKKFMLKKFMCFFLSLIHRFTQFAKARTNQKARKSRGGKAHKHKEMHLTPPNSDPTLKSGRPRFGSVRLRFGGGTVRAVPVFGSGGSSAKMGFSAFQYSLRGKNGSGSGFGSWKTVLATGGCTCVRRLCRQKTVLAVPVLPSVSGKTVPTVPVPGSGSVPEPPCKILYEGPPT